MKKKAFVWIIAAVLILVALTTIFLHRASEDPILAKRIEEQAQDGVTKISLNTLTDFDWDQAMIYGPYTSKEMIEDTLDIKFKGSTHGIELREDLFLLVFANGKYAVKTVELSRRSFDYSENDHLLTPAYDHLKINHYAP